MGAGAELADDGGSGEATETTGDAEAAATDIGGQEPGGEGVTGAGGVDQGGGRGVDVYAFGAAQDGAAVGAPGEGGEGDVGAGAFGGGLELVLLVEAADLGLVGEQDVDVVADQGAEGVAVAADAEGVGERERDLAAGLVGDGGGAGEGLLGFRRVEQVALEIGDGAVADGGFVEVVGRRSRRRRRDRCSSCAARRG